MSHETVVNMYDGEPLSKSCDDVVVELKRMLEMAEAGELTGIAAAYTHADNSTSFHWVGIAGHGAVGALERMKARMLMRMDE